MKRLLLIILSALILIFPACNELDDERIPSMAVNINLSDPGLWNTYGVAGYGLSREFVKKLGLPQGFRYLERTQTGFGGVLLIGGMDPYTTDTNVPLAYDLACPVERDANIRVKIDADTFEAVCPQCGSKYDVTMAGGAPVAGRALSEHYRMRMYKCIPNGMGYMIVN